MSEEGRQSRIDDIFFEGEETGSRESDEQNSDPVFNDDSILEIDNVPEEERIHGRDEEIKWLARNLRKMATGGVPDNVIEWGETGTGKTLVARHVCNRLEQVSPEIGDPIVSVYVNCDFKSTYTRTFRKLAEKVSEKADQGVDVPYSGISAEHYRYEKLWPVVEDEFPGGLVVILDEMGKHQDITELLYTLSRSQSKDGVDVPVVTIGISNDIGFRSEIGTRARSSLQPEHRTYSPYDQSDLVEILDNRRDAFKDGIIDDSIIERVAELAAKEHGDARRAVRLLRKTGNMVKEELEESGRDDPTLTTEDVEKANEEVDVELFLEVLGETSLGGKLTLFAFCRVARNNPRQEWFRTSRIYETYKTVSKDVGVEPNSHNSVLKALNNYVMSGFLASKKKEGGYGGTHKSYSFVSDYDTVREGLIRSTPELQKLMGGSIQPNQPQSSKS